MRWQNKFVTYKFTGLLFLLWMSRNEAKEPSSKSNFLFQKPCHYWIILTAIAVSFPADQSLLFVYNLKSKKKPWEKYLNQKTTGSINSFFTQEDIDSNYLLFSHRSGWHSATFDQFSCLGEQTAYLHIPVPNLKYLISIHISLKMSLCNCNFR